MKNKWKLLRRPSRNPGYPYEITKGGKSKFYDNRRAARICSAYMNSKYYSDKFVKFYDDDYVFETWIEARCDFFPLRGLNVMLPE